MFFRRPKISHRTKSLFAITATSLFNCFPSFAITVDGQGWESETNSSAPSYGDPFKYYVHGQKFGPNRTFLLLNSLTPLTKETPSAELQYELLTRAPQLFVPQVTSTAEVPAYKEKIYSIMDLNNQGVRFINSRDYPNAITCFKQALLADPEYKLARDNLAIAHNNFGLTLRNKPPAALKQFLLAQFINPKNLTTALNVEGVIRLMGKDPDSNTDRLMLVEQARSDNDPISVFMNLFAIRKTDKTVSKELEEAYKQIPEVDRLSSNSKFGYEKPSTTLTRTNSKTGSREKNADFYQSDDDDDVFMTKISRVIKRNWYPPKGNISKHIVAIFRLHSDGSVSGLRIDKSSGDALCDEAAMQAISKAAPFDCLPPKFSKYVDIQFTFDYNVIASASNLSSSKAPSRFAAIPLYDEFLDDLERKIRKVWSPAKDLEDRQIVVLFSVDQTGKISEPQIYKSSGDKQADDAAIAAVHKAGKIKIPSAKYGPKVNVQFTFDKNLALTKNF